MREVVAEFVIVRATTGDAHRKCAAGECTQQLHDVHLGFAGVDTLLYSD
jgi:hypothetical protein